MIEYYPKMLKEFGMRKINELKRLSKVVLTSSQARVLYESVIEKYSRYLNKKIADMEWDNHFEKLSRKR